MAFFWEHPPLCATSLQEPYEVSILASKSLAEKEADPEAFAVYFPKRSFVSFFKPEQTIVSFPNLDKTAWLFAPVPIAKKEVYVHLATFVRHAPMQQVHDLWQQLGTEMINKVSDKQIWLSTNGLGVSWLHVRLDKKPKYYHHEVYQSSSFYSK